MLPHHCIEECLIISTCSPIRIAKLIGGHLAGTGGLSFCCGHHGSKRRHSRHRHHKLTHCCLPVSFLVVQQELTEAIECAGARQHWTSTQAKVWASLARRDNWRPADVARYRRRGDQIEFLATQKVKPPMAARGHQRRFRWGGALVGFAAQYRRLAWTPAPASADGQHAISTPTPPPSPAWASPRPSYERPAEGLKASRRQFCKPVPMHSGPR